MRYSLGGLFASVSWTRVSKCAVLQCSPRVRVANLVCSGPLPPDRAWVEIGDFFGVFPGWGITDVAHRWCSTEPRPGLACCLALPKVVDHPSRCAGWIVPAHQRKPGRVVVEVMVNASVSQPRFPQILATSAG